MGSWPRGSAHEDLFGAMDRAAIDPKAWLDVCDALADLVGGIGTALIPIRVQARVRACPYSTSLDELADRYFSEWSDRDFRAQRGLPVLLARGIAADQDFLTAEQIAQCPFYNELLAPVGLKWSLALSFQVNNDIWAAVIQGRSGADPFGNSEKKRILAVRQQLTVAAKQAAALGSERVANWTRALESGGRVVLGIDDLGRVLAISPAVEALLGADLQLRSGYLCAADPRIQTRLSELIDSSIRYDPFRPHPMPAPIVLRRPMGRSLHIDALPLPRDYQTLLTRIVAVLLMREADDAQNSLAAVLRRQFGLTAAEVRLALLLADGLAVQEAADSTHIRHSTARAQLRSIFAKTNTHRQGELVALMARLI